MLPRKSFVQMRAGVVLKWYPLQLGCAQRDDQEKGDGSNGVGGTVFALGIGCRVVRIIYIMLNYTQRDKPVSPGFSRGEKAFRLN